MRIAMVWDEECGGFPAIVTDAPDLSVFNIDERYPNDRVYLMGHGVKRVSPEEFDALVGDTIHQYGDKPIVEQAVRAMLNTKPNGKPDLILV